MNHIKQVGKWSFEIKQIFCRKTAEHGLPFSASAVISISNGEPCIELLINKEEDDFNKDDYNDLKTFIESLGFNDAKSIRFKK